MPLDCYDPVWLVAVVHLQTARAMATRLGCFTDRIRDQNRDLFLPTDLVITRIRTGLIKNTLSLDRFFETQPIGTGCLLHHDHKTAVGLSDDGNDLGLVEIDVLGLERPANLHAAPATLVTANREMDSGNPPDTSTLVTRMMCLVWRSQSQTRRDQDKKRKKPNGNHTNTLHVVEPFLAKGLERTKRKPKISFCLK